MIVSRPSISTTGPACDSRIRKVREKVALLGGLELLDAVGCGPSRRQGPPESGGVGIAEA